LNLNWIVVLSALLLAQCAAVPSVAQNLLHNPPPSTWTGRKTLTWLDRKNEVRYVDVYVPKSSAKDRTPLPVVMWFMGSRRNVRPDYHYIGLSYEDCDIAPCAEKNRFILVVIDQRHIEDKGWVISDSDDLDESLVLDVLAYLKKTFPVDASRVYLWGISAGGKLSQFLAAKHPGVFSAVVSFSGVFEDIEDPSIRGIIARIRESPRRFPIAHWQTDGDFEGLIKGMKGMLRLYRKAGYLVEFVWLPSPPGRTLKHEWYPGLYNQPMWEWCKQYSVVNGETVVTGKG